MSKKIDDAKKKCDRLKIELEKAKNMLKIQQKRVKDKEDEVNKANLELVNVMLLENDLTLQDLPDLIADLTSRSSSNSSSATTATTHDRISN